MMFGIISKSVTKYLQGFFDGYELVHYLVHYLQGGTLPVKLGWKSTVKEQMNIDVRSLICYTPLLKLVNNKS
jgi:hypothetical protein